MPNPSIREDEASAASVSVRQDDPIDLLWDLARRRMDEAGIRHVESPALNVQLGTSGWEFLECIGDGTEDSAETRLVHYGTNPEDDAVLDAAFRAFSSFGKVKILFHPLRIEPRRVVPDWDGLKLDLTAAFVALGSDSPPIRAVFRRDPQLDAMYYYEADEQHDAGPGERRIQCLSVERNG